MFKKKSGPKKYKLPFLLMLFALVMSFIVPTFLAQPAVQQKDNENYSNSDFSYCIDPNFMIVNYNEPSNPWVVVNYYYENGSHIRMVFVIDNTPSPTINLDYQGNTIEVFDKKGRLSGYGVRTNSKSNVYVYVPV